MTDPFNFPSGIDPQRKQLIRQCNGEDVIPLEDLLPNFPWAGVSAQDGDFYRKLPRERVLLDYFMDSTDLKQRFLFDKQTKLYWVYEADTDGAFSLYTAEELPRFVKDLVETRLEKAKMVFPEPEKYYHKIPNTAYLEEVTKLLKYSCPFTDGLNGKYNLPRIGFSNGCLFLTLRDEDGSLNFSPHSPQFQLSCILPHVWTGEPGNADYFHKWLDFISYGREGTKKVVQAFLRAVITGQGATFQKFLFLSGHGGTGKTSLERVFRACVGDENTHQTSLEKLETVRFEPANLMNKLLVLFPDEGRYTGKVDVFKSLTGGDFLPFELKGRQAAKGFLPTGLAVVSSNHNFPGSDKSGAIDRRIVRINVDRFVEKKDPEHYNNLEACTAGVIHWALSMSEEDMAYTLQNHTKVAPELAQVETDAQAEENVIHAFIDQCLVLFSDLPEPFQTYQLRKELAASIGFNTAKGGVILQESILPTKIDPRDCAKYVIGYFGEGVEHFSQFHKMLYAGYCTFTAMRGEKPYNLSNFKKALNTNIKMKLRVTSGQLPTNATGYPDLTLRLLLPPDLRESIPTSISRQQAEPLI